jgi:hypothetical protein
VAGVNTGTRKEYRTILPVLRYVVHRVYTVEFFAPSFQQSACLKYLLQQSRTRYLKETSGVASFQPYRVESSRTVPEVPDVSKRFQQSAR